MTYIVSGGALNSTHSLTSKLPVHKRERTGTVQLWWFVDSFRGFCRTTRLKNWTCKMQLTTETCRSRLVSWTQKTRSPFARSESIWYQSCTLSSQFLHCVCHTDSIGCRLLLKTSLHTNLYKLWLIVSLLLLQKYMFRVALSHKLLQDHCTKVLKTV